MTSRRAFITLLGGAAAAWPLTARAQQRERMRRVGVLMNGVATDVTSQSYVTSFRQGLRQLGWIEDQNLRIDIRWNAGDAELARIYAAQLIGQMPDVILAATTNNLTVVRQATSTVPIVFMSVSDPVAQGLVTSMTHPGGNITGFTPYEFSIGGKWLDLLKEAAPGLARAGLLFNPEMSPQSKFFMQAIETAAPLLGMQALAVPVRATADIEPALESFARQPNSGLIIPSDTFLSLRLSLIADLTLRRRLPAISQDENFPKEGGLMYYGTSTAGQVGLYRQAATYVDRILKGAKPGDLPIQKTDKYPFIVNLKTAKALGLTIPLPLLGLADEVIE